MTSPDLWPRVRALFDAALDVAPEARVAFVEARAHDAVVAREVASLLAAYPAAEGFLSSPGGDVALPPPSAARLAPGTRLGVFEIRSLVGAGGMGEVYRAHDSRLGRDVAIKVLPGHVKDDVEAVARLTREARAIAALSHPGILTIHDIGEVGGLVYLVTELLDGESLRSRLRRGPVPWREAVEIGAAIAGALAAAHARGIVHRDLKPENVVVTSSGAVKLLDFGVAKHIDGTDGGHGAATTRELTAAGMAVGTLAYMAPEQLEGREVDHRADQFALGILLYELVTGRHPYHGDTAHERAAAILRDPPPPLTGAAPETPLALARVVAHCLARRIDQRYDSTQDLARALQDVRADAEVVTPRTPTSVAAPTVRQPALRRRVVAAVVATLLIATAAGWVALRERSPSTSASGAKPRVAVLTFQNLGAPEDEFFAAGITEEITGRLSGISQLAVISSNSATRLAGTGKSSQHVGRELGADYVLQGSVRWQASTSEPGRGRVRVTPQLVRVADDTQVWADTYDRRLDEIFAVQSDIASQVTRQLGAAVLTPERRALEATPTTNVQAYDAYLRGTFLFFHRARDNDRVDALAHFERSVELDPTFAKGHAAVANAAAWHFFYVEPTPGWEARADAAVAKALALDPNLADAYRARGNLLWTQPRGFPHERAIRDLRRALTLNPSSAEARVALGRIYVHIGLLDEAREELTAALQLDPANAEAPPRLLGVLHYEHEIATLLTEIDRLGRPLPWNKVEALSRLGRDQEALALATQLMPEQWVATEEDFESGRHYRVVLLARLGQSARVDALLPGFEAIARNPRGLSDVHHVQYSVAQAHALRGRTRQAVEWLRKSAAEGFPCYPYFAKDPHLASLKGDAEFEAFMAALKQQWEHLRMVARS